MSSCSLNVHKVKTKILKINTAKEDLGIKLEEFKAFAYFGSIIDKQGGADADVKTRIGKARAAYLKLKTYEALRSCLPA